MLYTIDGFDQQTLVELGLTVEHVAVLRWFVDCAQCKADVSVQYKDGFVFSKIDIVELKQDLPILQKTIPDLQSLIREMEESGLFISIGSRHTNFRFYRLTDVYLNLIERN